MNALLESLIGAGEIAARRILRRTPKARTSLGLASPRTCRKSAGCLCLSSSGRSGNTLCARHRDSRRISRGGQRVPKGIPEGRVPQDAGAGQRRPDGFGDPRA